MSKSNYKKVNKLSKKEIGYIAGFIDGEGTITLQRCKSKESGKYYRRLALTISGVEIEPLKGIMEMVGAGKITNRKPYNKLHSPSYTFQINSQQAIDLLSQIHDNLLTYKRKRAELVLKDYKSITPRNGKYNADILKKKDKFIKNFFSILPYGRIRQKVKIN